MKILDFQRQTVNIRNRLIHYRKLLLYFLIHLKNPCNIRSIFIEHSRNVPIFNIPGTLFQNIPRNLIGNFLRIFRKHIMGMFHEYSTNIYLPGVIFERIMYNNAYNYLIDNKIISQSQSVLEHGTN